MQIWFVFSLILSVLIALFAVVNSDIVTIRVFWFNFQLSQSLVIIISAALGAIITIFLGLFGRIKSGFKIIALKDELRGANQKIETLSGSIKNYEVKDAIAQNEKLKTETVIHDDLTE